MENAQQDSLEIDDLSSDTSSSQSNESKEKDLDIETDENRNQVDATNTLDESGPLLSSIAINPTEPEIVHFFSIKFNQISSTNYYLPVEDTEFFQKSISIATNQIISQLKKPSIYSLLSCCFQLCFASLIDSHAVLRTSLIEWACRANHNPMRVVVEVNTRVDSNCKDSYQTDYKIEEISNVGSNPKGQHFLPASGLFEVLQATRYVVAMRGGYHLEVSWVNGIRICDFQDSLEAMLLFCLEKACTCILTILLPNESPTLCEPIKDNGDFVQLKRKYEFACATDALWVIDHLTNPSFTLASPLLRPDSVSRLVNSARELFPEGNFLTNFQIQESIQKHLNRFLGIVLVWPKSQLCSNQYQRDGVTSLRWISPTNIQANIAYILEHLCPAFVDEEPEIIAIRKLVGVELDDLTLPNIEQISKALSSIHHEIFICQSHRIEEGSLTNQGNDYMATHTSPTLFHALYAARWIGMIGYPLFLSHCRYMSKLCQSIETVVSLNSCSESLKRIDFDLRVGLLQSKLELTSITDLVCAYTNEQNEEFGGMSPSAVCCPLIFEFEFLSSSIDSFGDIRGIMDMNIPLPDVTKGLENLKHLVRNAAHELELCLRQCRYIKPQTYKHVVDSALGRQNDLNIDSGDIESNQISNYVVQVLESCCLLQNQEPNRENLNLVVELSVNAGTYSVSGEGSTGHSHLALFQKFEPSRFEPELFPGSEANKNDASFAHLIQSDAHTTNKMRTLYTERLPFLLGLWRWSESVLEVEESVSEDTRDTVMVVSVLSHWLLCVLHLYSIRLLTEKIHTLTNRIATLNSKKEIIRSRTLLVSELVNKLQNYHDSWKMDLSTAVKHFKALPKLLLESSIGISYSNIVPHNQWQQIQTKFDEICLKFHIVLDKSSCNSQQSTYSSQHETTPLGEVLLPIYTSRLHIESQETDDITYIRPKYPVIDRFHENINAECVFLSAIDSILCNSHEYMMTKMLILSSAWKFFPQVCKKKNKKKHLFQFTNIQFWGVPTFDYNRIHQFC